LDSKFSGFRAKPDRVWLFLIPKYPVECMPHLKEAYPNTQLYKRAAMKEKKVVKKKNYE